MGGLKIEGLLYSGLCSISPPNAAMKRLSCIAGSLKIKVQNSTQNQTFGPNLIMLSYKYGGFKIKDVKQRENGSNQDIPLAYCLRLCCWHSC